MILRRGIVITWLLILVIAVAALFWYNEWVYSLPTPVPVSYKLVHTNEHISITEGLKS
ncbi:MAG: hypothetical protein WDO15_21690 [Bacteroidota bacterium]